MYIKTIKFNKKTAVMILAVIAVILALIVLLTSGGDTEAVKLNGLGSTADRIAFLSELGWEANPESETSKEVVIPKEFSDTYESYNNMQKAQGFDLSKHMGEQVTVYTYEIHNYEGCSDTVQARLYVLKNRAIAGDIHSTALDGFMHGIK